MKKYISRRTVVVPDKRYGMIQPVNAVGGANDTGNYEDSPCPSSVREREIKGFCKLLKDAGIKYITMFCPSTNCFMVRNFVLVHPDDHDRAFEIAEQYRDTTVLFYTCPVKTENRISTVFSKN